MNFKFELARLGLFEWANVWIKLMSDQWMPKQRKKCECNVIISIKLNQLIPANEFEAGN